MLEIIPKNIRDKFTIINKGIKYPTYPDQDFQNSISDDKNLNNYTEENIKKSFTEFITIFNNCKNISYEIIEKNLHDIQQYCRNLNVKIMNYVFHFYLLDKIILLVKNKYYKNELSDDLKKELFFDDVLFECSHLNDTFSILYKTEYKEQNDINKLSQIIAPIIERYNKLLKGQNEIGNIIIRTIKFLNKYIFIPFEEELNKFKKIDIFYDDNYKSKINEENEIILLDVLLYMNKLQNLGFAFYNASILEKNDICNLNENTEEWKNLEKIFFRIIPKDSENIRNKMLESRRNPDIGLSILSNIQANDSSASIIFSGLKNFAYYKANENKSKIVSKKYQLTNSFEKTKDFIGMFKKFKYLFTKLIPSIEFRRKIYVKKELSPINRVYIEKLLNFMKGENNPVNSMSNLSPNITEDNLPTIYRDKVPDKKYKRNYVSVTILHNEKIFFKDEQKVSMFSSFFSYFQKEDNNNKIIQINNQFRNNTIMIAVHGGGFIASSTLLHERYLRKWVKNLNIPIFGINYSLAPNYPYPEGLNDVYQAYMWILKHAKEELNMDVKHIIITGDSAGGNLVLALNNLLIVMKEYDKELGQNIIFPDLVLVQYPVTYVSLKSFSNSFLFSLHSNMLNINSLKYIYDQYVGHYEIEDEDPFLNPIKINNFILTRMKNKIRIFFGTEDVLRGDGLRLLNLFSKFNNREENQKNKIDARGYEIIYFGHGFNGFNEEIQQIGRNVIFPEIEEFLKSLNI